MCGLKGGWKTGEDAMVSVPVVQSAAGVSVSAVPQEQARASGI